MMRAALVGVAAALLAASSPDGAAQAARLAAAAAPAASAEQTDAWRSPGDRPAEDAWLSPLSESGGEAAAAKKKRPLRSWSEVLADSQVLVPAVPASVANRQTLAATAASLDPAVPSDVLNANDGGLGGTPSGAEADPGLMRDGPDKDGTETSGLGAVLQSRQADAARQPAGTRFLRRLFDADNFKLDAPVLVSLCANAFILGVAFTCGVMFIEARRRSRSIVGKLGLMWWECAMAACVTVAGAFLASFAVYVFTRCVFGVGYVPMAPLSTRRSFPIGAEALRSARG